MNASIEQRIEVSPILRVTRSYRNANVKLEAVVAVQEFLGQDSEGHRRAGIVIQRADLPGFVAALIELMGGDELKELAKLADIDLTR